MKYSKAVRSFILSLNCKSLGVMNIYIQVTNLAWKVTLGQWSVFIVWIALRGACYSQEVRIFTEERMPAVMCGHNCRCPVVGTMQTNHISNIPSQLHSSFEHFRPFVYSCFPFCVCLASAEYIL